MTITRPTRRLGTLATLAVAATALGTLALPAPASAQVYLGWDFGHGFGIGLGAPPSAYMACPTYGWGPLYPNACVYPR